MCLALRGLNRASNIRITRSTQSNSKLKISKSASWVTWSSLGIKNSSRATSRSVHALSPVWVMKVLYKASTRQHWWRSSVAIPKSWIWWSWSGRSSSSRESQIGSMLSSYKFEMKQTINKNWSKWIGKAGRVQCNGSRIHCRCRSILILNISIRSLVTSNWKKMEILPISSLGIT